MPGSAPLICKAGCVTAPGGESALRLAWSQQDIWSRTAQTLKTRLTTARVTALVLTIAGAVLATAAGQLPGGASALATSLAVAAAIAVGAAPLALRGADTKAVKNWTRARAASEAFKAEICTYMAGVAPYRGPGRDNELADRVQSVSQEVVDLLRYTRGTTTVNRELPPINDVSTYVQQRVASQLRWYRGKAKGLERRLRLVKWLGLGLSVIAVVLGALALKAGVGRATAWVPTTATLAAAMAAYAAWARYEYQFVAYLRTADALEWILTRRETSGGSDAADDEFVAQCERIISDENKDWVTEWARSPSGS
jgi:hypothetical protein